MADTPPTDPNPPAPDGTPAPGSEAVTPAEGKPAIHKAKIVAPSVMEGIDEDEIYELEPDAAAASVRPPGVSAPPSPPKAEDAGAKPDTPADSMDFVRPGLGGPKVWGVVGAVLLVGAILAVGVNSTRPAGATTASIFLTLYNALLHTGTGVVAVWAASLLAEKRLGRFELAAARMFTAVAALSLVVNLRVSLFTASPVEQSIWAALLGAAAYVGAVAGLFRIWGQHLGFVVGGHLALWLLVQVGMLLSALAAAAPKAAG